MTFYRKILWVGLILVLAGPLSAADPLWISQSRNEKTKNKYSNRNPHLSFDGRFVVFQAKGALMPDDKDRTWDIYLFDQKKGDLRLLTPDPFNYTFAGPDISANGQRVAFHGYPHAVVKGRSKRMSDVFLMDLMTDKIQKITTSETADFHNGESLYPQLNKNGSFMVFSSNATNLWDNQSIGFRTIYFYKDHPENRTWLGKNEINPIPDRSSLQPILSSNGRFVAFRSAATNLDLTVSGKSLQYHLYMYDIKKEKLIRADLKSDVFDPDSWMIGQLDIDREGRFIVFDALDRRKFESKSDLEKTDIFYFERKGKEIRRLIEGYAPIHTPSISGKGRFVVFLKNIGDSRDQRSLYVMDRKTSEVKLVEEGRLSHPSISGNAKWIVYESKDLENVAEKKNDPRHVFLVPNPFFE